MKKKVDVIECDVCGYQQVQNVPNDLEVLGLTLNGFYAGPTGGGPIPKDLFVCNWCITGEERPRKVDLDLVSAIASMGLGDWQQRERERQGYGA